MNTGQGRQISRRAMLALAGSTCLVAARRLAAQQKGFTPEATGGAYHVYPGGRIQDALEAAARDPVNKTIFVHAGTYRPSARGQAMIWFNERHDGITLEAVGDVVLTAANPELAERQGAQRARGRQPRRLFRRRDLAQHGNARLPDHRRQQLHHRHRRAVANRIGRDPQDRVLLHRRRRHQGLRAILSDDRARRGLRQLRQPVRRRRLGRASRAGAGIGAVAQLHLPQQPHPDDRRRRSTCCTAATRRSRTVCSSATSRTWAWTTSAC